MKPTPAQLLLLQKYLRKNLKYRETYVEFYDHILTAVEVENTDILFDDLIMKVIKDNFGGTQNMRLIEDKYKRLVFKELKIKYINLAMDNLKFPGIFITAAFGLLYYFMVKQPWFSLEVFFLNMLAIRAIPDVLRILIKLTAPKVYGAPLQSIKRDFFKWQNFIPAIIFFMAYMLASSGNYYNPEWLREVALCLPVLVAVMLLMTLHSLTYYKVCRDDIKAALKLT